MEIKSSNIKGMFYPKDKKDLYNMIQMFDKGISKAYDIKTRALVAPHAGYIYSGKVALEAINYFDENIKNIFIVAPSHRTYFEGTICPSYDEFETPFSNISVNKEIVEKLFAFNVKINNIPFENEHSLEVQLPLIQYKFKNKNVKIVPILYGETDFEQIYKIINYFYDDNENGFIISTDLSHFYKEEEANIIDRKTFEVVNELNLDGFKHGMCCGLTGLMGLTKFVKERNFSLIPMDYKTSSSANNDKTSVVGYGSWILSQTEQAEFIKEHFKEQLFDIVKKSITYPLCENIKSKFTPQIEDYHLILTMPFATFVTIYKNGHLRGCIGSIIPSSPIIEDIANNAYNASYKDPRFYPLVKEEFCDIEFEISILTPLTKLEFKNQDELLDKIKIDIDGLIIHDKNYQAVYLPQVWEHFKIEGFEDKDIKLQFLQSLKEKAGLNKDHFSDSFEAYIFHVEKLYSPSLLDISKNSK
ncbi:MAG: hypothetical protein BHW64_05725 [Candidatus Melainabacteria bacterium LEY3_CP_29_8]|nr:MAG: hypothetical protein BHW64_05725 [Candidatus Melainabacteria bacterium LEY3_CP_29_8]